MGRDIIQQQMEFCVELKMSLVFTQSELQARDNPLALCAAAHYQPVTINGWKDELILWKLSFIWVKILHDIACNLNWIEFKKINLTQLNTEKKHF